MIKTNKTIFYYKRSVRRPKRIELPLSTKNIQKQGIARSKKKYKHENNCKKKTSFQNTPK